MMAPDGGPTFEDVWRAMERRVVNSPAYSSMPDEQLDDLITTWAEQEWFQAADEGRLPDA